MAILWDLTSTFLVILGVCVIAIMILIPVLKEFGFFNMSRNTEEWKDAHKDELNNEEQN